MIFVISCRRPFLDFAAAADHSPAKAAEVHILFDVFACLHWMTCLKNMAGYPVEVRFTKIIFPSYTYIGMRKIKILNILFLSKFLNPVLKSF